MGSVRRSPMPSAPNRFAGSASAGVSALVRTPMVRISSTQSIKVAKSPDSSGSVVGTRPSMTSPAAPSMVIVSPAPTVMLRAVMVWVW